MHHTVPHNHSEMTTFFSGETAARSWEEINLVDEKSAVERGGENEGNRIEKYGGECDVKICVWVPKTKWISYEEKRRKIIWKFLSSVLHSDCDERKEKVCGMRHEKKVSQTRWAMRTRFLHPRTSSLLRLFGSEKHVNVVIKNIQMTTVESLI